MILTGGEIKSVGNTVCVHVGERTHAWVCMLSEFHTSFSMTEVNRKPPMYPKEKMLLAMVVKFLPTSCVRLRMSSPRLAASTGSNPIIISLISINLNRQVVHENVSQRICYSCLMIPLMLFNEKNVDEITHQFLLGWNLRKEWFQIPLKGIKKYIYFTYRNYFFNQMTFLYIWLKKVIKIYKQSKYSNT